MTLQVTGTYEDEFYLPGGLIIYPRDWKALTGYGRPNVMVLYQADPDTAEQEDTSAQVDTAENEIETMPVPEAVRKHRRSTRFPSLPNPQGAPEHVRNLRVGMVLPFGFVVRQEVYTEDKPLDSLSRVYTNAAMPLVPAVVLMLVCLAMGLTVVAVMLSVDHQRGLGIMKALGARAADVRGLYSRQFLVDFAVATAMGTVLSAAGINLVARAYGLPLSFPWVQSLLWLLIGVPVVWWGGQATAILFENADSLQLLSREAQFDWWALLRFGGLDKR
jgi:hypothetical protein